MDITIIRIVTIAFGIKPLHERGHESASPPNGTLRYFAPKRLISPPQSGNGAWGRALTSSVVAVGMPSVTDYLSSVGSSIARAEQKSMPGHKLHRVGL